MKLYTEEKKQTICIGGVAVAACRLLYPRIEGKEKINEFYKQITENLVLFFCEKAEAHRKSLANRNTAYGVCRALRSATRATRP